MDSIISALKDTPIPTILVMSGIVFLLLALAGQIAGKVEVPAERQKWSALAGALLLSAGLLLYIIPSRPQRVQENNSASPTPAAATQPAPMGQPTSSQSGGESPTPAGGAANRVQEEGGSCFDEFFTGLSADHVERFEVGVKDKRFLSNTGEEGGRTGIVLTDLGQPVIALTFILFEEDGLFKIGPVVNASCHVVEYANAGRASAKDVLQNWDTLEVKTGSWVYYLRFGYSSGTVEIDSSKTQK